MSVDSVNDTPWAIVDLGSWFSAFGEITLDRTMQKLGLDKLNIKEICQQEHLLGPSSNPMKTVCAARVLFTFSNLQGGKVVNFDIWFDVMVETFPFLTALLSLLSMKAFLNFRYSNFSTIIDRAIYLLKRVKYFFI